VLLLGVRKALALGSDMSELALVYYDIFVRHAFTNYRDIMKEVSHSNPMGEMLSFRDSRSFKSSGFYPDENYAREIMQLFTMGLWHLHDNGTKVLDTKGEPIATYVQVSLAERTLLLAPTNAACVHFCVQPGHGAPKLASVVFRPQHDKHTLAVVLCIVRFQDDVVNFARAWTGFVRHSPRANLEVHEQKTTPNHIDPLKLRMSHRDTFPRTDLVGGQYSGSSNSLFLICLQIDQLIAAKTKWRTFTSARSPGTEHSARDNDVCGHGQTCADNRCMLHQGTSGTATRSAKTCQRGRSSGRVRRTSTWGPRPHPASPT